MKFSRFFFLAFITFIFCTWVTIVAAYCQTTEDVELRSPNYVCEGYGFGVALPDGYITFETEENDVWALNIIGETDQPSVIISVEELPENIIDVAGYWQHIKDRDPLMAQNITYEMHDSVAGTGAVLSRIEMIESNTYILVITWIFVHDGYGFSLAGYPPSVGDYTNASDLAMEVAQQFRWMSVDEIAEFEASDEIEIPEGRDF